MIVRGIIDRIIVCTVQTANKLRMKEPVFFTDAAECFTMIKSQLLRKFTDFLKALVKI